VRMILVTYEELYLLNLVLTLKSIEFFTC